jgi:hypothetical protein
MLSCFANTLVCLLHHCFAELLEGEEGFALSQGTWQRDGWRELDDLRKKLENLKELRELVRSLGRSGGKGPLRKAPEEVRVLQLDVQLLLLGVGC